MIAPASRLPFLNRLAAVPAAVGRFFFVPDRQRFVVMLALIVYALALGCLAAAFVAYVRAPLPVEVQDIGTGLRDLDCPDGVALWDCITFAYLEEAS